MSVALRVCMWCCSARDYTRGARGRRRATHLLPWGQHQSLAWVPRRVSASTSINTSKPLHRVHLIVSFFLYLFLPFFVSNKERMKKEKNSKNSAEKIQMHVIYLQLGGIVQLACVDLHRNILKSGWLSRTKPSWKFSQKSFLPRINSVNGLILFDSASGCRCHVLLTVLRGAWEIQVRWSWWSFVTTVYTNLQLRRGTYVCPLTERWLRITFLIDFW
jgi:hypothetical protein